MVTVILTCFNRKEKTMKCLESLVAGNPRVSFVFVVVDDASNDGSLEMLEGLSRNGYDIHIIKGDGILFWSGGMRKGMDYAKNILFRTIICL